MTDLYLIVRIVNICLSAVVVGVLIGRFPEYRRRLEMLRLSGDTGFVAQLKLFGFALCAYALSAVYGSVESALRQVPGGSRTWLLIFPPLIALAAILWPVITRRRKRNGPNRHV